MARTARSFQQQGLLLHFISRQQQLQHAAAGLVPEDHPCRLNHPLPDGQASATSSAAASSDARHPQLPERLAIGDMRTLLQLHMAALIEQLPSRVRPAVVAWVLDDDKRLLREPTGEGAAAKIAVQIMMAASAVGSCDSRQDKAWSRLGPLLTGSKESIAAWSSLLGLSCWLPQRVLSAVP